MTNYHEPFDSLSTATQDSHRAIVSLIEELEAIDWYAQRAEACGDAELRAILIHNKNEEIEHAMMVLEWLRRNDSAFATNVAKYLFARGPIASVDIEKSPKNEGSTLGIGSLKGELVTNEKG